MSNAITNLLKKLNLFTPGIRKFFNDIFTNVHGNYDPAYVFGYGYVFIGANVFIGLSIYDTIKNGKFDSINYAAGLATVSTTLVAAAAGVSLKKSAENPTTTDDKKDG